jgi:hypothetical protein
MEDLTRVDAEFTKSCPSAPVEPGSSLFGIVAAKGQIAYITPSVPVTHELLVILGEDGVPIENRLRFAGPCMEHRCVQWKGEAGAGRCGLIDQAIDSLGITSGPESLPLCGIRSSCRWFAQYNRRACAACPEVIRRPKTTIAEMAGIASETVLSPTG